MSLETAIAELTARAPALATDCVVNREAIIRNILTEHVALTHDSNSIFNCGTFQNFCDRFNVTGNERKQLRLFLVALRVTSTLKTTLP